MLSLKELEKLEERYLDRYYHFLMYAKDKLFEGFDSANDLRDQWEEHWDAKGKFDKGAERIVYSFFNTQGFGIHNSTPVASDLFFQTDDAMIHIDLKTIQTTNIGDGSNKHDIEQNQSSYPGPYFKRTKPKGATAYEVLEFNPHLPKNYTVTKPRKKIKPCLTYFIVIIFEPDDFNIPCMYISCMPNGRLRNNYGDKVLSSAKNKGKNARYHWEDNPFFELLPKNQKNNYPGRIRVVHYDDKENVKDDPCNICDENGEVNGSKGKIKCKRCKTSKIKPSLKGKMTLLKKLYKLET